MTSPSRSARFRLLLPLALLAGAGYWAVQRWSFARTHEATDNAQIDGHIVPVVAKVGGYVTQVRVGENAHVADSGVLVELDAREYDVRLAQAEADLAGAMASSGDRRSEGQASAFLRTASSQREVGDAQVIAARATLTKATADLTRARELVAKQIISLAQLDAAQATYDAAVATLTATERSVNAATSGVSSAQAGVRLAQARLAASRAARDNAALQRSYTRITAPVSGIVSRKSVEVGQLVQPGQTLMSIVSDSGVYVTANFKETQLARIRVGQKVELEIDAYGGEHADGEIESIASATGAKFALLPPDNATGNFTKVVQRVPVRIRIRRTLGADRPLRPGMSVQANVIVK
ncbi:MAG: HlyD family secretion protein [Gemmatimonadaceae bacterium]|nr:HlyD family secretion protein [Gemmatimonadaceae bacterium]